MCVFYAVSPWSQVGEVELAGFDDLREGRVGFGGQQLLSDGCNELVTYLSAVNMENGLYQAR